MSVTEQVQRAIKQLKLPLNLPPETRVPVLLFPRENPELTSRLQEISREGIHGSRVPEEDIITIFREQLADLKQYFDEHGIMDYKMNLAANAVQASLTIEQIRALLEGGYASAVQLQDVTGGGC
ncbi:hypothetical protein J4410_03870 [Candidatus Woesearchaeota archaeon]|nr:hypothetical protein [Candidatus Woesearchaeota archaeon]